MKQIIIILIFFLFISGCSLINKNKSNNDVYNSISLRALVEKAINGDTTANKKLNYLVDLNLPVSTGYNSFNIDSIKIQPGKKFYLVFLNFPNPVYNRFAVYDSTLRLYLLDKSLNGNLFESVINVNGRTMVKILEDFISKDVLTVDRLSLYRINLNSAKLVFRDFIKLAEPNIEFDQKITEISADRIKTEITSTKNSTINDKGDVFVYDYSNEKYASSNNVFSNFIINRITNFNHKAEKPEISDKKSLYASVGIDINLDTIKTTGNTKDIQGFTLTLTDNWKTIKNIAISDYLNKEFKGTRYINEVLGASISVIMIPPQDSAEMYINYKLGKATVGKYRVRYSDRIATRKEFVQFFEYSCGTKKFILILRASKFTYEKHKDNYQTIINSFSIDC